MCNLLVRSGSCMKCLRRKAPALNGRSAASAAVFKLICLSLIFFFLSGTKLCCFISHIMDTFQWH